MIEMNIDYFLSHLTFGSQAGYITTCKTDRDHADMPSPFYRKELLGGKLADVYLLRLRPWPELATEAGGVNRNSELGEGRRVELL